MDNCETLNKWVEYVSSNTSEEISNLFTPEAVIYTDEDSKEIKGTQEIKSYYEWLINSDPTVDVTYTDNMQVGSTCICNGLLTMITMKGYSYKRFTFVVIEDKIITLHISINPEPITVG